MTSADKKVQDYIETEREREEGHQDTAQRITNARTRIPISDATLGSM